MLDIKLMQRHYQLSDEYDEKLVRIADQQHRPVANLTAHLVMAGLDAIEADQS